MTTDFLQPICSKTATAVFDALRARPAHPSALDPTYHGKCLPERERPLKAFRGWLSKTRKHPDMPPVFMTAPTRRVNYLEPHHFFKQFIDSVHGTIIHGNTYFAKNYVSASSVCSDYRVLSGISFSARKDADFKALKELSETRDVILIDHLFETGATLLCFTNALGKHGVKPLTFIVSGNRPTSIESRYKLSLRLDKDSETYLKARKFLNRLSTPELSEDDILNNATPIEITDMNYIVEHASRSYRHAPFDIGKLLDSHQCVTSADIIYVLNKNGCCPPEFLVSQLRSALIRRKDGDAPQAISIMPQLRAALEGRASL